MGTDKGGPTRGDRAPTDVNAFAGQLIGCRTAEHCQSLAITNT